MTNDPGEPLPIGRRLAPLQLILCALMGLGATFYVILQSEPAATAAPDHDGAWTLAASSAFEIFLAQGGEDTMLTRIREVWEETLPQHVRRRLSVTQEERPSQTLVGTIRIVEFLSGAFFLGFERSGESAEEPKFFSESGDEVTFEPAILEATDQTHYYIYWRDLTPPAE